MTDASVGRGLPAVLLAVAITAGSAAAQTPAEGFTLFAPLSGTDVHLLDVSGTIVHTWSGALGPGNSVYLMDNGNLLRTIKTSTGPGGVGGGFQEIAWDGTVLWDYQYNGSAGLHHHDVKAMPNGNVLFIAWQKRTVSEAIANGRDPGTVTGTEFWPLQLIEVEQTGPTSGQIVWQWDLFDHIVQDFDPLLPNFGDPAAFPGRVDINYPPRTINNGDWVHANGMDYDPVLDQIVVSANFFDEIWVLDHSTTTAEAAGSTGGNTGRGGELLYRWGNPEAYRAGTSSDRKLFGQHDATWIRPGRPGEGDLLIFNNGNGRPAGAYSSADQITPPLEPQGTYTLAPGTAYGPAAPHWSYVANPPTSFYTAIMGGAERLPNGNTLLCEALTGRLIEVDSASNTVWTYQNALPNPQNPRVFKARRYDRQIWPDAFALSAASGGSVVFEMQAPLAQAGRPYRMLGTLSGTAPGTLAPGGLVVPLNRDAFSQIVLTGTNTPGFQGFAGVLDAGAAAQATVDTLGPFPAALAGRTAHFAFVLGPPYDFASQPVAIELIP